MTNITAMRRVPIILIALVVAALVPTAARADVNATDLKTNDVVFGVGVSRPAGERAKLQAAADALRAKSFPTKFVVVAGAPKDIDAKAAELRRGLAKQVGIDNIDAVLVLAPHRLGVSADVFDSERATAVQDAIATLKTDDIAGTILVANRLQQFDQAGALPGDTSTKSTGGGIPGWLIAIIVLAALAVIVGAVLARRAAKRAVQQHATDDPATPNDV